MAEIRKMELRDVPEVYALGIKEERFNVSGEANTHFWTPEQLSRWVRNTEDVLLVAEDKGRVIGYALSQYHSPTRKAVFENLHVQKDYEGKDIGKGLATELIQRLKEKGAYINALVEPDNLAIIKILEKREFKKGKQMLWMDLI